ncbi:MAG: hypothetical protein AAGD92_15170 [Pseudomonadota bacterium]
MLHEMEQKMTPKQEGQQAANQGQSRPIAGSDKASQERVKAYDEQIKKNAENKK